jgi:hypothetical protein
MPFSLQLAAGIEPLDVAERQAALALGHRVIQLPLYSILLF